MECDSAVHTALLADWLTDLRANLTVTLEAKKTVLIYSGDKDFICNWRGGEQVANKIEWKGKEEFAKANYTEFLSRDGTHSGDYK